MTKTMRTVLWRSDAFQMFEYCALKDTGRAFQFEGVVLTQVAEKPTRISYQVLFDQQGLTQMAELEVAGGSGVQQLRLAADEQRKWHWNGSEVTECRGFLDVDLGFSPATNSLPIRRLNLDIGESHTLTAAWVRFPEFDVVPFPQRYTRLGSDRYLFESLISDFKAELVVDEFGMVRQYGTYWQALSSG